MDGVSRSLDRTDPRVVLLALVGLLWLAAVLLAWLAASAALDLGPTRDLLLAPTRWVPEPRMG
jgi:hypothetical protein